MAGLNKRVEIRVSEKELKAWRRAAEDREMELAQWIRSACATFSVCGKRTVLVPAAEEPAYVAELRKIAEKPAAPEESEDDFALPEE